jgi:hypothetical protein
MRLARGAFALQPGGGHHQKIHLQSDHAFAGTQTSHQPAGLIGPAINLHRLDGPVPLAGLKTK